MYGIACALRVVIIHDRRFECKFSRLHERQRQDFCSPLNVSTRWITPSLRGDQ